MTNAAIQKRIVRLEAELKLVKREAERDFDFSNDEKNWKKMKPTLKKARTKVFKARYG